MLIEGCSFLNRRLRFSLTNIEHWPRVNTRYICIRFPACNKHANEYKTKKTETSSKYVQNLTFLVLFCWKDRKTAFVGHSTNLLWHQSQSESWKYVIWSPVPVSQQKWLFPLCNEWLRCIKKDCLRSFVNLCDDSIY